jgi:hypothetical protein
VKMMDKKINDLLSFSVFFLINELVGLNSIVNSRHGIMFSLKVQYKFIRSRWNRIECSPFKGLIPCLEFTLEIESNSVMYNPNKAIRDKVFPIKIGKFSVKYYTFEELKM